MFNILGVLINGFAKLIGVIFFIAIFIFMIACIINGAWFFIMLLIIILLLGIS